MALGRKTGGGSRKGIPNRRTAERKRQIAESGLTPLDFMLAILRDESKPQAERFEAAKHAAPYIHPKLANVDAKVDVQGEMDIRTIELIGPDEGAS